MNLKDCEVGKSYTNQEMFEIPIEANDYGWHTGTGTNEGDCMVYHGEIDHDKNHSPVVSFCIKAEDMYVCVHSSYV